MYISPIRNNLYNISFARKKIPVYALDEKGNYQRFNSKTDASKAIGVTTPEIVRSAENRFHRAGGYFIVNADELEKRNDNGEIIVYQKDIDEILAYRTINKAIYAIDKKGNYKKFQTISDASKELDIDRRAISSALSNKHKTANGYFFVHANTLELSDENGNITVDSKKIKELIEKKPQHPIYAIDKQGNYIKFSNQDEASKSLGVSRQRIAQVLNSRNSTCSGYYIVSADKVESENNEGKVLIDKAKVEEILIKKSILTRSRSAGMIKKVYAIDSKGNYRKFNSRQEASMTLGVPVSAITNTIIGCQKTSHGLTFVNAKENEKVSKDRKFTIDNEKLNAFLKERFPKTTFLF